MLPHMPHAKGECAAAHGADSLALAGNSCTCSLTALPSSKQGRHVPILSAMPGTPLIENTPEC